MRKEHAAPVLMNGIEALRTSADGCCRHEKSKRIYRNVDLVWQFFYSECGRQEWVNDTVSSNFFSKKEFVPCEDPINIRMSDSSLRYDFESDGVKYTIMKSETSSSIHVWRNSNHYCGLDRSVGPDNFLYVVLNELLTATKIKKEASECTEEENYGKKI